MLVSVCMRWCEVHNSYCESPKSLFILVWKHSESVDCDRSVCVFIHPFLILEKKKKDSRIHWKL